jgi:hypothetical protein
MSEELLGVGSRVKHPAYGDGVVIRLHLAAYEVAFMTFGIKMVPKTYDKWAAVIEQVPAEESVTFTDAEKSLMRILRQWADVTEIVPMADKWDGGTMVLQPADTALKTKEVPIDQFFHKIVMTRDRLRVMEQKINSSKLNDAEKVELQQYITRIYGSLTTFNVLFKHKEHYFVGQSSSSD